MRQKTVPTIGLTAAALALIAALFELAALLPALRTRYAILARIDASTGYHAALGFAALLFAVCCIWLFLRLRRKSAAPRMRPLLLIAAVSLLLNCALSSYRCLESLFFADAPAFNVAVEGATRLDLAQADDPLKQPVSGTYAVDAERESCVLRLSGIHAPVENLFLDLSAPDAPAVAVVVSEQSDGWSGVGEGLYGPYAYPEREILASAPNTRYLRLHPSGDVHALSIEIKGCTQFTLSGVALNAQVPFRFSMLRALLLAFLLLVLFLLAPRSAFYDVALDWKRLRQRALICAVCLALIVLLLVPTLFVRTDQTFLTQYEAFSEMLLEGRVGFDYAPSSALASMENPYDYSLRCITDEASFYLWDHAYYNGQFYMYFGVVPELLLFLPFRIITGRVLRTVHAVQLCIALICVGFFLLIYRLAKRFFKPSLPIYLLLASAACASVCTLINRDATLYNVPISAGVMFAVWGLALWLGAKGRGEMRLRPGALFMGSLCIALVFGCRPQMGLVFLLAVPLFYRELTQSRILFSRSRAGVVNSLALLLPFFVVAAGLMWYNAARFGSPFDFGSAYNLTTNDMTRRGFHLDRIPAGLYALLFSPPVVTPRFPFLQIQHLQTAYQGVTVSEGLFGGVFGTEPLLLSVPLLLAYRKRLHERGLWGLCALALALCAVVAIADIELAGVLTRYLNDFLFLLWLCAAVGWLFVMETADAGTLRLARGAFAALLVLGLFFACCKVFTTDWGARYGGAFYSAVEGFLTGWH